MSTKIIKTYQAVFAELTFNTALHIGTGRGNDGTDALLRRNNAGDLMIPGTAIAGALRTLATRIAPRMALKAKREVCVELLPKEDRPSMEEETCGCAVCRLFGEFYPNKKITETENDGGRASRLWIYDAQLTSKPTDTRPFVRDGVGIDRRTGTAASAAQVKFDTEIVPAGAKFELRVELEDVNGDDQMLLAAALAEWQAGRAWLGGNTGRGLGNAKLDKIQFMRNALFSGEELLAYLKADDPKQVATEEANWLTKKIASARGEAQPLAKNKARPPFIIANFQLAFDGPFLMHDATAATVVGFDHLPLLDAVPGFDQKPPRPLMAGSGLRGVMRSHAERIARTIASFKAYEQDKDNAGAIFREICPACNPLENRLDQPLTRCDELIKDEDDKEDPKDEHLCLGCILFGSTVRGSRLKVMDAKLLGEPRWKPLDFLAIDRFTGGGLDGAKFDAMALWRPTFEVQLNFEEPKLWELGWLALLLRDMADKRLTFGFGAAKGFGHAQAQQIEIQCGFLHEEDWSVGLGKNKITGAGDTGFYCVAKFNEQDWETQKSVVSKWVEAFHERLKRKKETLPARERDSYFDGKLDKLYPLTEV